MKTLRAALTLFVPMSMSLALAACGGQESEVAMTQSELLRTAPAPTLESLGRRIFFDQRLSEPAGQSCASCHDPEHGFADARPGPTSEGAIRGRFGARNTPSITYAKYIGELTAAGDEAGYAGGMFWDGRSPDLEDQAYGPMLNPLEMNNPDTATVADKLKRAPYARDFLTLFGSDAFADPDQAFDYMTQAVSAYERDGITGRFTSKYDAFLAGRAHLSASEQRGLTIFEDPARGNCASCHLDKPASDGTPPLFTDFGYDNLGIPKNTKSKYLKLSTDLNPDGEAYIDHGLSIPIHNPRQNGKFKAPTLRNIALTAPYGHNGYFKDLRSIVHFYNTRDVAAEKWEAPEIDFGMNVVNMGNLGLSAQDEADLVAFMETLTDGYFTPGSRH